MSPRPLLNLWVVPVLFVCCCFFLLTTCDWINYKINIGNTVAKVLFTAQQVAPLGIYINIKEQLQ